MQQHFPNIPLATAIAGGAVISRLLDVLADKGLLSREEILAILGNAQRSLTPTADQTTIEAARVVGRWQTRFKNR